MSILEKIKNDIAIAINERLGNEIVHDFDLVYPPDTEMGDLSLPCFVVAKQTAMNPAEVANVLKDFLGQEAEKKKLGLQAVFSVGPYLNFRLDYGAFLPFVIGEVKAQGLDYGKNESGGQQKTMIEFSNVNTHKEYHVGHLRNLCFGDSVHRLMQANGYESIPVSYVNDFGIHVAKTLWAYQRYHQAKDLPENKGFFLGQVYVQASTELKEHPERKEEVGEIMKRIESRDSAEYQLWEETRLWSIAQFDRIYKELGIRFEKVYYENETIDQGREMVKEMLERGILRESEGAVIADLTEQDLGVLVVLRSDGTATYPVADLPLARKKFDEYGLDASIYVVDIRQALYFKQLFYLMRALGYKQAMIHLGYDFVALPEGMMSSRSGRVISYEDLRAGLLASIDRETRARHPDWNDERVQTVAEALTVAVIKFEMLKVGARQPIIFDIEKAMSFQGFTAAYLLYTVARIESLLRKSEQEVDALEKSDLSRLQETEETALAWKLARYPEAVRQAAKEFDPSIMARYVFELAQVTNDYYHRVQILKADKEEREARLALLLAVKQVLINGLGLLGIATISEM